MTLPSNIFEFWLEKRREFPVRFTLSTHTVCVPASSAALERIFSASGLAVLYHFSLFGPTVVFVVNNSIRAEVHNGG